jgi:hypothetical protein
VFDNFAALVAFAKPLTFAKAREVAAKLAKGQDIGLAFRLTGLLDVLRLEVEARFKRPELRDDAVVQLHLDRVCYAGKTGVSAAAADLAAGRHSQISVIPPIAHGAPIEIAGLHWPKEGQRLKQEASSETHIASLCLEIGLDHLAVKAVLATKPKPYALREAAPIHGLDFGYANTATLSSVPLNTATLHDPKEVAAFTKDEAREYLTSHTRDIAPALLALKT